MEFEPCCALLCKLDKSVKLDVNTIARSFKDQFENVMKILYFMHTVQFFLYVG